MHYFRTTSLFKNKSLRNNPDVLFSSPLLFHYFFRNFATLNYFSAQNILNAHFFIGKSLFKTICKRLWTFP